MAFQVAGAPVPRMLWCQPRPPASPAGANARPSPSSSTCCVRVKTTIFIPAREGGCRRAICTRTG